MLTEKLPFVDFIELKQGPLRINVPLLACVEKLEKRIEELEKKLAHLDDQILPDLC